MRRVLGRGVVNAQGNVVDGKVECIFARSEIQRLRLYYLELSLHSFHACHDPINTIVLAGINSRMETFWYRLAQVGMENSR